MEPAGNAHESTSNIAGHQKGEAVPNAGDVIDIGGSHLPDTLREMLERKLLKEDKPGQRLLPSALLSDDKGLRYWRELTHLLDYYQTRDEIHLLEQYGPEIAQHMAPGSVVLDLGSGDVRKIKPFLDRLEAMRKDSAYYGLDLSRPALEENMRQLVPSHRIGHRYEFVQCFALWGTFDDVYSWAKKIVDRPRWFCSLGSQFGNDHFDDAVAFLSKWAAIMRPEDRMLIGMDGSEDREEIWRSYHDPQGLFEEFIRNGYTHSNTILGSPWYRDEDWDIRGVMQDDPLMHRWVIRAKREVIDTSLGLAFEPGDEIDCYEAFKYGPAVMHRLFAQAGLEVVATWKAPSALIYEYLLKVSPGGAPAASEHMAGGF